MYEIISVIVPVYNQEKYLEKCVYSIINQTYTNLEIILIDDGSIDKSSEICDYFASVDNRVKVIHKNNEGVSKARNLGIKSSTGDFITFVDSDDWIEKETYNKAMEKYHQRNDDIIEWGYFVDFSNENDKVIKSRTEYPVELKINQSVDEINNVINHYGYVWNKIYKSNIIKNNNIVFDENISLFEDSFFNFNLLNKGYSISFINSPLSHYVQREGTLGRKKINKYFFVRKRLLHENYNYLSKRNIYLSVRLIWYIKSYIRIVIKSIINF